MLHARLNTSPTPGRVLRGTSVLRRWFQLLWRVWEHYVTDRWQEWRDVIGLTQQKLRWFQNILVGKVESERLHIHVWVHECARLGDFTKFSIGLLACLSIGLVQIWILGGLVSQNWPKSDMSSSTCNHDLAVGHHYHTYDHRNIFKRNAKHADIKNKHFIKQFVLGFP